MHPKIKTLFEQFQKSGYTSPEAYFEANVSPRETVVRYDIPITETYEEISPIPEHILRWSPHPYESLGAPYKPNQGPFYLRHTVVQKLLAAQSYLQDLKPGYRLKIFDAYRSIEVQTYMVEYETGKLIREAGYSPEKISPAQRQTFKEQVLEFWAEPETDERKPPPHSTGAAVDLTIIDDNDEPLNMGTAIDFIGRESYPNHYANSNNPAEQGFHQNRELLNLVMQHAGFKRLPFEWWHFSYGDNWWALLEIFENPNKACQPVYGRIIQ